MAGQARMIGSLQSIGLDDRLLASLPAKLDEVSVKDIQAAGKKYLVTDNLTVMHVIPPKNPASNTVVSKVSGTDTDKKAAIK